MRIRATVAPLLLALAPSPGCEPPTPAPVSAQVSVPSAPPAMAPGSDPASGAGPAAVAAIRAAFVPEHSVVPGSVRVFGNVEARAVPSLVVGGQAIPVDPSHLSPPDPNRVLVTGEIEVFGEKRPFLVYLLFDPASGHYRKLDIDIHDPPE